MSEIVPILDRTHSRKGAVVPKSTRRSLVETLRSDGWVVEFDKGRGIGRVRRQALRLGLALGTGHIHFCEADRLTVWAQRRPEELARIARRILDYDFLVIGRTERAFRTHPRTQRDTEAVTNAVCSLLLGRMLDVTCASRGFSKRAAQYVVAKSKASGYETDVEWPMLMFGRREFRSGYIASDGLEYEDWLKEPNRVRKMGYESWLRAKEMDRREWNVRTRATVRMIQTALRLYANSLS